MNIFIEKENKDIEIDKSCLGIELLEILKINPATVILVRNDEVILEDEALDINDKIKILSVISGG